MVLDFTDSKNRCYLGNVSGDDSEVALARMTTGMSKHDVDRIVSNMSKFFTNLAHKVGLNIIGSGPKETAICCSMGPNIKEMLCQNAQMQLVQFVKAEKGLLVAKLVWFDELSPNCAIDRASFVELKRKREHFMSLFNSSWTTLVKVVLGDGDRGVRFYRKTSSGVLVPENILQSGENEVQPSQTPVDNSAYSQYSHANTAPPGHYYHPQPFIPPVAPMQPTKWCTAQGSLGVAPLRGNQGRPLKRRRQEQQFTGQCPSSPTLHNHSMTPFLTQEKSQPLATNYPSSSWSGRITTGIPEKPNEHLIQSK